jgi:hypothetical protein
MIYQNFDLEIISPQGGQLCARVLESPQGDCPFMSVKWPFEVQEESAFLAEIYGGLRQRRARSGKGGTVQDFGGKLFEAVFSGDIEHLFRSSLETAARSGKGLRIRLRLPEDSELHARPWEFLFDTESREFLAVRENTPLIRYLPVAQPIQPITVEGPLRVLVAMASPTDHPRLDIAKEWDILCQALEPPITAGRLKLERVRGGCTFDNLRDSLRHFNTHIFHFVGHGLPGALVLEQESGRGQEMEATHLRSAFPSGALPRLIVLNACSGAIEDDVPFSGLAQGFLKQGVPAVVAMQASITDNAALIFTRYFYRDLIETGAVDTSLTEARLRMQGNGHPIEWGTPVLYMRALSGQLFQPPANQPEEKVPVETHDLETMPLPKVEPGPTERKKTREPQLKTSAPPPQPAPNPTERKKPRTARSRASPPPEAELPAQTMPPKPPPREHTAPPKVEPKPEPRPIEEKMPAKAPAKKLTPPPKLEPKLDPQDMTSDAPAREPAPVFRLTPEPDRQSQLGPAVTVEDRPPGQGRAAYGRWVLVYAAAGVLLAAILAVAFGVGRVRHSHENPAPPTATSPSTSPAASTPMSGPAPAAEPSPAVPNTASASAPVQASETSPRPPASVSHKTPRKSKPVPQARSDNCKNADVSERSANCLFQ